jgi:hypothetical protein
VPVGRPIPVSCIKVRDAHENSVEINTIAEFGELATHHSLRTPIGAAAWLRRRGAERCMSARITRWPIEANDGDSAMFAVICAGQLHPRIHWFGGIG